MILKYFELKREKLLNNILLFYGSNEGLKDEIFCQKSGNLEIE